MLRLLALHGLAGGAALIVWSVVESVFGLSGRAGGIVSAIISVGISAVVIRSVLVRLRDSDDGLGYSNGFRSGLAVSAIAGLIAAGFLALYGGHLRSDLADRLGEKAAASARLQGLSESEARRRSAAVRENAAPHTLALSALIGTLLNGAVLSPLLTLFLRRRD